MYYIVDAGIDPELMCSRPWKASQLYTPDSQTLCYNTFKKILLEKEKKKIKEEDKNKKKNICELSKQS